MTIMSQEVSYAKLKAFEDLVRFVAMSPTPFLFHIEIGGKQVYFVQVIGLGGGRMVYYTELDRRIKEKYVVFNLFRGEVSFSDQFSTGGQSTHIPIFELEKTNVFEEYPPK